MTFNSSITPISKSGDGRINRLLELLPDEDFGRLSALFEVIKLKSGEMLYDSGDEIEYVYFPTNSIVSLFYTMKNGATAEMGMVARYGIIGFPVFLGGKSAPHQAVVQIAGDAYRIKAKLLQEEFARSIALQQILLRYTQALITQISQIAVCNRLHTFEQRFCRWLLLSHDRVKSDELLFTQEIISHLLGVRREGVTVSAKHLQDAGFISYVRGHIYILDRRGLESIVCECYQVITDEYERLLAF